MLYHLRMTRKLVAGIGIYERGHHPCSINGVKTYEYALWNSLMKRCALNGRVQMIHTSYLGCESHETFKNFQLFAGWCQHQIGFGITRYQLDKDILVPGNRIYGPDTCCFVPSQINTLLTYDRANNGDLPTGISLVAGRYKAQVSIEGRRKHIGYFDTPEAAHEAYKAAKLNEIHRQAAIYKDTIDPRAYAALMAYSFE